MVEIIELGCMSPMHANRVTVVLKFLLEFEPFAIAIRENSF